MQSIVLVNYNSLAFFIKILILCFTLPVSFECIALSIYTLSDNQIEAIGRKIWTNECQGSVSGLVFWNAQEDFPSLGICHFIWYPDKKIKEKKETFPDLINFLKRNKIVVPLWMTGTCPWINRDDFLKPAAAEQIQELRTLLKDTILLQAKFIIQYTQRVIPHIINSCAERYRDRIANYFSVLLSTHQGIFAVIDYINFKGDGTYKAERYKGQGWGLIQVLERMALKELKNERILDSFIETAKEILQQRVELANLLDKNEKQFLKGWYNRIDRYNQQ